MEAFTIILFYFLCPDKSIGRRKTGGLNQLNQPASSAGLAVSAAQQLLTLVVSPVNSHEVVEKKQPKLLIFMKDCSVLGKLMSK